MSNIFILTWLDISGKRFKSGYDAAQQYEKALGCGQLVTTVHQLLLPNTGVKRLVGIDPGFDGGSKYTKRFLERSKVRKYDRPEGVRNAFEDILKGRDILAKEKENKKKARRTGLNNAVYTGMDACGKVISGALDRQIAGLQADAKNCYVVSTNKSHNLSWALSKQAFQKFGKAGRPKVVINIDQHTDCGTGKGNFDESDNVECGNWGQFHLSYQDKHKGQDDRYYVVLGCSHKYKDKSGIFWSKQTSPPTSGKELGGDAAVLKKLKEEMQKRKGEKVVGTKDCDVYITIDNDVFNTPITHYPAGERDQKYVWAKLDDALNKMGEGSAVVGGDVTGLPKQGAGKYADIAIATTKIGMKKITSRF